MGTRWLGLYRTVEFSGSGDNLYQAGTDSECSVGWQRCSGLWSNVAQIWVRSLLMLFGGKRVHRRLKATSAVTCWADSGTGLPCLALPDR
jgi:hypothetical protein